MTGTYRRSGRHAALVASFSLVGALSVLVSTLATKNPSSKRPYAYYAEGVTGVDSVSDDQR